MTNRREAQARLETNVVLVVLLLGSLWGATEALLGGLLHRILPPVLPGRIMLVIAMVLLAYAVRKTGRPWMPFAMAMIAGPLKLMSAAVYALPVAAPEVVNPALAILAQGACFAAAATVLLRGRPAEGWRLAAVGGVAGALQVGVWAGLVHWPGAALYPSVQTLQVVGAKLAPAWIGSAAAIADLLRSAVPVATLSGAIGSGLVGALPPPRPLTLRPSACLAGSALCLTISFAAPWLL